MSVTETRFQRQLDIVAPDQLAFPIVVIGAGAIGSAAVMTLAKMGCSCITVWDDDILEEVNVPNQLCKVSMVGRPKLEALQELTEDLTGVSIGTEQRRYRGQKLRGVVIAAVDSMDARLAISRRAKLDPEVPLLIDARMGAEFARIYSIRPCDPGDIDFYEQNLYGSSQAEQLPCSARSVIYAPLVIASFVANFIKDYATGEELPLEVLLDLPSFMISKHPAGTLAAL